MKFEPIEQKPKPIFTPCIDHEPYTFKEKCIILFNPKNLITWFIITIFGMNKGLVFFGNCKHIHQCKNIKYTLFGDCTAGEWK